MEKVLDILTRLSFDANPEDLAEVNKYITKQTNLVKELETKIESLNKERAKSGLAIQDYKRINTEIEKSKKALDNLNGAYKTQTGLIEKLTAKQRALQEQMRSAGTVKEIRKINNELSAVNKQITGLTSTGGGIKGFMSGMAGQFAAGLGAVAALNAGIQFLNNSFAEFSDSEKITRRLQLSLSNFGKQRYFDSLVTQADNLAKKIGYLDNDDIVNAQNKLVTFGKLSINQIKALTPVIVDFAAKQQVSIEDATTSIIGGLEGQGRAFRQIGVSFKEGKTTAENYKTIMTDVFDKVKGSAEDFGETMEGVAAKSEQAIKDMQEQLGGALAPWRKKWLEMKLAAIGSINELVDYFGEARTGGEKFKAFMGLFNPTLANQIRIQQIRRKDIEEQKAIIEEQKKLDLGFGRGTGADQLINPNADTDLKDGTKGGDKKNQLLERIRAAEESTALRIIDLNNQVKNQRIKGEEESIEKIKERIAIDRQGELDKLELEIAKNSKDGINSPILAKNFGSLRGGINTKFDDQQAQEIKAFNEKTLAEQERFDDQVIAAEIDLLKRKADLNKDSIDIELTLIDKTTAQAIRASNAKYDALIKDAKKFGKDYTLLVQQREDAVKAIESQANEDKKNKNDLFIKEQFDSIRQMTINNPNGGKTTLGELIGLSDEEIENISKGIDATENLTAAILSGIDQVLQAEIEKEQKLIDKQKERVEKATEEAKKGNSAILTAETDRLQKQEEAQQKRVRSQRTLNAILVASQSAVNAAQAIGVVLNSATGDPYTIALRVVAAVAAIVGGVAATTSAIRSAGQTDTGFYDGDYTGDGNPRDVAGVVHKKEFVYTAKQTKAIGKENLRYIAKNELKPQMMSDGSMVLSKTGNIDYAGIREGYTSSKTATPNFSTKALEQKVDSLVEVMQGMGVDVSVDENGLAIRAHNINMRNLKMKKL